VLQAALFEARAYLDDILGSRYWRYTAPGRLLARAVRSIFRSLKGRAKWAAHLARDRGRRARSAAGFLWEARQHPPHFPAVTNVVVSIVIVTHNHGRETLACLRLIQERIHRRDYEVILVLQRRVD
jgi:hypothetical protein